jgi:dTDP-4-dehydrorhamnose 3,5-epimerase
MRIVPQSIPDVVLIEPVKHGDHRGFFSETFREDELREAGIRARFVQENHSYSQAVGTLRGLHFQTNPHAQAKLLRVVRGAILDVVVDIRAGSPTYGKHVAVELSAANWKQLYVPVGFAHGFVTTEPDTEILYKVSDYYSPECDRGLAWDDAALAIVWPVSRTEVTLSAKDRAHPPLSELPAYFSFTENHG